MLDQEIREVTRQEHQALEKEFLKSIRGISTHEEYARFLMKLYGYYAGLEAAITPYLCDSPVTDYDERRKVVMLENDLNALGSSVVSASVCRDIPDINSFHSALGVLYVLEGSTLGGRIIAGIIGPKVAGDEKTKNSFSFFLSYGGQTESMWRRFGTYLRQPYSPLERQEIIASALLTFSTLKQWITNDE